MQDNVEYYKNMYEKKSIKLVLGMNVFLWFCYVSNIFIWYHFPFFSLFIKLDMSYMSLYDLVLPFPFIIIPLDIDSYWLDFCPCWSYSPTVSSTSSVIFIFSSFNRLEIPVSSNVPVIVYFLDFYLVIVLI